jgi:hypothetical protein
VLRLEAGASGPRYLLRNDAGELFGVYRRNAQKSVLSLSRHRVLPNWFARSRFAFFLGQALSKGIDGIELEAIFADQASLHVIVQRAIENDAP